MKKLLLTIASVSLFGCSGDTVRVDTHGDRITDNEAIIKNALDIIEESNNRIQALEDLRTLLEIYVDESLLNYYTKSEVEELIADVRSVLEDAGISFVRLCPNSDELAMKQGDRLYAVGFNTSGLGGLMALKNGTYYTTTDLSNSCKFKVAGSVTSDHTYGHNIESLFPFLQNSQSQVVELISSNVLKVGDICFRFVSNNSSGKNNSVTITSSTTCL